MTEENRKALFELRNIPTNNVCADCKTAEPEWASANLGIFVCIKCSGVHRCLGTNYSVVKSLILDSWTDEKLRSMIEKGNEFSNKIWEKQVPVCYRRPSKDSPHVLREQWIRSKYERMEFIEGAPTPSYLMGEKEGILWKREKDQNNWNQRKFILSTKTNSFAYYIKTSDPHPKDRWLLSKINAIFADEKTDRPNCLQIMNTIDGKTRNLFVSTDTGQEIVEWYMAIRFAKLKMLKESDPSRDESELAEETTKDFTHEGKVWKRGPRDSKSWKDRWMTVDGRRVTYSKEPTDAFAKGEIVLGTKDEGYEVTSGFTAKQPPTGYGFEISTPSRVYEFSAASEEERDEWTKVLNGIISMSLTPVERKALTLNMDLAKQKSQGKSLPRKLSIKAGLT
ncbi:arf-GAP with dual PH domain-containing protein 1-like [Dendronephthya gigantea]|uniref:arf-GAP with dual PH domain-containing protein 1-like n=1 Tax=Dendronephthya gigantea TaxID=151771 RepID=UPI00106C4238|nr:arf-GAP with dual PH domain-containing protein 1-like [Dendronephthya gigantea]